MKRRLMLIGLVSLLGIVAAPANPVSAEYLGDLCWIGLPTGISKTVTIKMGVFHEGGSHYSLRGHVINTEGRVQPGFGTLELIGGEIYLSFMTTDVGDFSLTHAKLDPNTLGATTSSIGFSFNPGGDPRMSTRSATLTPAVCP